MAHDTKFNRYTNYNNEVEKLKAEEDKRRRYFALMGNLLNDIRQRDTEYESETIVADSYGDTKNESLEFKHNDIKSKREGSGAYFYELDFDTNKLEIALERLLGNAVIITFSIADNVLSAEKTDFSMYAVKDKQDSSVDMRVAINTPEDSFDMSVPLSKSEHKSLCDAIQEFDIIQEFDEELSETKKVSANEKGKSPDINAERT
jgi:hypothetical protein